MYVNQVGAGGLVISVPPGNKEPYVKDTVLPRFGDISSPQVIPKVQ